MKKGKPSGKDVFGNGIYMATENKISKQRENCDRLLLVIGKYMGWDGDISHVFVSDLSTMGDFCLEEKDMAEISREIGCAIEHGDYLHDICLRMNPKQ